MVNLLRYMYIVRFYVGYDFSLVESIAYSPTVPLLKGQSRFLVQNLLLSHFFAVFLCTSLPLNLIVLAIFRECPDFR